MSRKRRPGMFPAMKPVLTLAVLMMPGWFGHIRYWTPIVHKDDHRDLARQALRSLLKEGIVERGSEVARHGMVIEESCGHLDRVESEVRGTDSGGLERDNSHFYDPVARRGFDDGRLVNALEEYRDFWARALVHYRLEELGQAFTRLGYCCHLLQDMAVPAHTHCVMHGPRNRTADNLELVASSRCFRLRVPAGSPRAGDEDAHEALFVAMAMESRGREAFDTEERNEIAGVLERYYDQPGWTRSGWQGAYLGTPYYPYHRFLPSSPRIRLGDMVALRNFLMCRAAERTAQLVHHFALVTGCRKEGPGP